MRELREHCKNHPILEADGRCATCWGYFCDACLDDIGDRRYCEQCAPAAQTKVDEENTAVRKEVQKRLDLRLLMYTLILMLGVVVGGSIIMFNGGIDQFFGDYIGNYQVQYKPLSLGDKLSGFEVLQTKHFNVYYHNIDMANSVVTSIEERYTAILADLLIFDKDVMARGKFNILIVADDTEFKSIYPDILPNRVAMTDYATKAIVIVEANEQGNVLIDLTHELAHAIFFERMRSGNKIPDWLQEGLASYEESKFDSSQTDARWATFGAEISQGGGKPLAELTIPADAGPDEVNRFYAESQSVTSFLINNFGMLKFMTLATKLQSGEKIDAALGSTYENQIASLSDLQTKWLDSLKI
jgi:hypothetical protein